MSTINTQPTIHSKVTTHDKYKNVPKPYMDVAVGMESQFTNHLLAQMQKTAPSTNPENQATKIYKSLLDNERSKMMAETNTGIGVKDVVLDQIYPKHMRRAQNTPQDNIQMYKKNSKQVQE